MEKSSKKVSTMKSNISHERQPKDVSFENILQSKLRELNVSRTSSIDDNFQLKFKELEKYKIPFSLFFVGIFFGSELFALIRFLFSYMDPIFIFVIIIVGIVLASIRQINQYERGVKFAFGKYVSIMEPGWRIVIPIFQSYQKVDMRIRAVDVPDQEAITKDNISVTVNAAVSYTHLTLPTNREV